LPDDLVGHIAGVNEGLVLLGAWTILLGLLALLLHYLLRPGKG
jgi:hypothetical protein